MTVSEIPAVLARARQGDSDAFCVLVERHSRGAFRLAFRMTGNEQDAEDVVQESLIKAYRHLGRFETRADFGTWLYRIVANCAVDMIRGRQSRQKHRSEVHTSELQSQSNLVCRLLLEKKKKIIKMEDEEK